MGRDVPSVEPCAASVGKRLVCFNQKRESKLNALVGDRFDRGEETVHVRAVANGTRRNSAKSNRVELEIAACLVRISALDGENRCSPYI